MGLMDKAVLIAVTAFIAVTCAERIYKRDVTKNGLLFGEDTITTADQMQCIALDIGDRNTELHKFGQIFVNLSEGLQEISNNNRTGDVILFVGNTGAGKSSLVHILAGDTDTFVATEIGQDSGNFIIEDTSGKSVTTKTTESTTVYPEAVADRESNVIFFDTPGFRDTRSSIHEIVATLGLHKVATLSRRIKIALLVNHNSLTTDGPRDDFLNMLDSVFKLLKNENKYKNSIYLIASKVVNQIIFRRGNYFPVSDETYHNNIADFLNNVVKTLKNVNSQNQKYDRHFLEKTHALIKTLVHKDENSIYNKIALFKKPSEPGPIMNSGTIQQSIASIREKLVDSDDDYVDVEVDDFGFTLSDSAVMYIKDLYELMNIKLMEVSKTLEKVLVQFLQSQFNVFNDIVKIRDRLAHTRKQIEHLVKTTNSSKYPHQYVDAVIQMTQAIGVNICNNETFEEINQLDEYLKSIENITLKDITSNDLYTPKRWAESFRGLERIVKDEEAYYTMLQTVFDKLSDYSSLNDDFLARVDKVLKKNDSRKKIVVNQHNYAALMKHLELDQYASLKLDEDKLDEINTILTKARVRGERTLCTNGTLTIIGDFLKTQTLHENKITSCNNALTIALLATNKLYIDSNLETSVVGGRNLVMIAPEWQVMGKFSISVDGVSVGDNVMKKAFTGLVGQNGEPGRSAGKFVGVALRYVNSKQLTISASGGDGQDGQEGGDGSEGKDGKDGDLKTKVDSSSKIYVVYNSFKDTSIIKSDHGTLGGDAGMGGIGGMGGLPGSVVIHSLTDLPPDPITKLLNKGIDGQNGANGKPGKGGLRGCDVIVKDYEKRILFIPVSSKTTYDFDKCERRNKEGRLIWNDVSPKVAPLPVPPPPSICNIFKPMSFEFEKIDDIMTHSQIVEFQGAFNKKFDCFQ